MKWDEKCKFYVCTFYVWCSFCLNVFKLLMILHLRSSWLWKTGRFLEDTANLLIAQIRIWVPHPFLWNYCFIGICLQSFMILFQWVLGCKNWVEDLRVIANLLFGTLLTQIREYAMPIFKGIIVILEHIYNLVMILHPTSSWLWKSGLVFESHSQFANSGSSAPNKEIGCHAHFLWNYCFIWIFTIISWFCIQQALVGEIWVGYLRVTVNLPFFGLNASNEQTWCHTLFQRNYYITKHLWLSPDSTSNRFLVGKIRPSVLEAWLIYQFRPKCSK